ncbi:bifunctional phosphopantothenoylcysteine decarboxylase/phosphopantothenate--cysteine ligase CoaBC [Bacillus sp. PS06]|uniref:bifunctional phosphopantothenoylcysteine decarboxylase/phosphopantothenate--cysteine ligase CoaBC n=1 Tax=Bacillus sp. PS06 TaxID=2764176 RepID=UPI00177B6AFC|nr:bifunctional phosphopantothenoylcysteine decarboxylase/phosphopantothenate--cysteine ligase CoaBC [Bacillus sp. PS06]MBD8068352.1 bifunctional phosphopantothenoylcysteine decarboxylase/phosphopantothenate--cysteine ligase CoaBC [Bacillus sp. PS06]
MLFHKKILLCVSGGIAVYKAAALTSKLSQAGAQVKIIMTDSAKEFVTPLTFQALSRNDVFDDTFDEKDSRVIAHIDLADWADLVIVAPATANTIAKLANGIADNMLTSTLLATTAPVWIAPAMNVHMYEHPAVQKNISILADYGYRFIEPSEGHLACGYVGKGRLEEPEKIIEIITSFFNKSGSMKGKKVLVTAGPTREKIDPVRFVTNHSTGKMGYAIAEEAASEGAEVILISGPTNLPTPNNVHIIHIETAEEMYNQVIAHYEESDVVIKTAAVADYRPKMIHSNKVKKQQGDLQIDMERTIDILKTLGEQKKNQVLIGFAAETENVEEYARKKLLTKNLDMIIANNITEAGAGFAGETNIVTIYKKNGTSMKLPLLSKKEVAKVIIDEAAKLVMGEQL